MPDERVRPGAGTGFRLLAVLLAFLLLAAWTRAAPAGTANGGDAAQSPWLAQADDGNRGNPNDDGNRGNPNDDGNRGNPNDDAEERGDEDPGAEGDKPGRGGGRDDADEVQDENQDGSNPGDEQDDPGRGRGPDGDAPPEERGGGRPGRDNDDPGRPDAPGRPDDPGRPEDGRGPETMPAGAAPDSPAGHVYVGSVSSNDGQQVFLTGAQLQLRSSSPWTRVLRSGMWFEAYGRWEGDVFVAEEIVILEPADWAYYRGPAALLGPMGEVAGAGAYDTVEAWTSSSPQFHVEALQAASADPGQLELVAYYDGQHLRAAPAGLPAAPPGLRPGWVELRGRVADGRVVWTSARALP